MRSGGLKEKYRYVGLLATDPRDKLYLARLIRQYCPDVALFTVQSDLLYAHPEYNRYLEGMIVGSTYPLFNSNQLWSPPRQGSTQRLQFPRNMAQGAYNATLALLDRGELVDYGAPFGSQLGRPQPPIWLTVVGHEALWPLEVGTGYDRLLKAKNLEADERSPYTYVNTPPGPPTAAERLYRLVAPRHFQLVGWLVTWGLLASARMGVGPAVRRVAADRRQRLGVVVFLGAGRGPVLTGLAVVVGQPRRASPRRGLGRRERRQYRPGVVRTPQRQPPEWGIRAYPPAVRDFGSLSPRFRATQAPSTAARAAHRAGLARASRAALRVQPGSYRGRAQGLGRSQYARRRHRGRRPPRPLAQRLAMDQHCALRRSRGRGIRPLAGHPGNR